MGARKMRFKTDSCKELLACKLSLESTNLIILKFREYINLIKKKIKGEAYEGLPAPQPTP